MAFIGDWLVYNAERAPVVNAGLRCSIMWACYKEQIKPFGSAWVHIALEVLAMRSPALSSEIMERAVMVLHVWAHEHVQAHVDTNRRTPTHTHK